jgi:GNAT superfamily N-acetyltransferase
MDLEYLISTNPEWFDLDVIHTFLSEESYWARGVPREVVARSIANSLGFGVYLVEPGGSNAVRRQVGYARVITDRATIAYVGDVFILPEHRGRGLSKRLMETMFAHPDLQGLRRWLLVTADAHELYRKYGFGPLAKPDRFMERHDPDIYKKAPSS